MSLIRIGILSLFEIFGDFMLKDFATTGLTSKLCLGIIGYIGVVISLIWSFKTGNVMAVNGLWDGMSTIIESLAAYIILGNRLENPYQYFGLGIIILGVFMLKYNPK